MRQRIKLLFVLPICFVPVLMLGCATVKPEMQFYAYDYRPAISGLSKDVDKADRNMALRKVRLASAYITAGDYFDARDCFSDAAKVVEQTKDSGQIAAVVGSESSKVFKGDPFEKCMIHFYTGIIYYREGDYERALAAFRRSLDADKDTNTSKEESKDDFAAAHYMAGKCYMHLGELDNAKIHLEKAKKYMPNNPYLDIDSNAKNNFTLLLETGHSPLKQYCGPGNSMSCLAARKSPEESAEVYVDGKSAGKTGLILNLFEQARSHGLGKADAVQITKGVIKEVVSYIPLYGALAGFIPSEADIRIWDLLPEEIHIYNGYLDPGLHTISFKVYGKKGKLLERYNQVWYYIPIEKDKDNVLYLRSGFDKCNAVLKQK